MAWIEHWVRSDGGTSYQVRFRLGGGRTGPRQKETFSASSDAENLARAEGFKTMVDAAGQMWPEGWVKGYGFVRPAHVSGPTEDKAKSVPQVPTLVEVGTEYVNQIVEITPGQRKRYHAQLQILAELDVAGPDGSPYRPFAVPVDAISEADVRAWLIGWDRAVKTKANYHGLLHGVIRYAIECGHRTDDPCQRTAPKNSTIRASRADLRFLTETELVTVADAAGQAADVIRAAAATGLRLGELTALWVGDIDLDRHRLRVNKAWKRQGEGGATDIPRWLRPRLKAKHTMPGHYLGNPKTPKSKRTIALSVETAAILRPLVAGRAVDDFVLTDLTGRPIHHADLYRRIWAPLMTTLNASGIAPFRFHDLRHSHVAWLIAGGVPLPHIQARLGHESIATTIDTYGHLLPSGGDLINAVVDNVLAGETIRGPRQQP